MLKKVSIIMSVFNEEKVLKNSIKSILNQSHTNLEFLILNDSSNDKTIDILNCFQKTDKRIKVFNSIKNNGLTKSLNFLISKVKSDFIFRQDADDVSNDKRIELQLEYLLKNNLDACTTRTIDIKTQKEINKKSFYLPKRLVIKYKNPFIHGSLLIRKNVIESIGYYNEKFYYAQDFKLFSDLIKSGYKIRIFNKILYSLNTENNISTKFTEKQNYYANCVKKNLEP